MPRLSGFQPTLRRADISRIRQRRLLRTSPPYKGCLFGFPLTLNRAVFFVFDLSKRTLAAFEKNTQAESRMRFGFRYLNPVRYLPYSATPNKCRKTFRQILKPKPQVLGLSRVVFDGFGFILTFLFLFFPRRRGFYRSLPTRQVP